MLDTPDDKLQPETRAMLMKALEQMRAAGAEVVIDRELVAAEFYRGRLGRLLSRVYLKDGADQWICGRLGRRSISSGEAYTQATGVAWPTVFTGERRPGGVAARLRNRSGCWRAIRMRRRISGGRSGRRWRSMRRRWMKFHLDGLIYPSAQMPPPDETMPQDGELSTGPEAIRGG